MRRLFWTAFAALAACTVYGLVGERLFAQPIWHPEGVIRMLAFSGAYWALAVLLLRLRPSWFFPAVAVAVLAYSEWWCLEFFNPLAPPAVLFILGSCLALGTWLAPRADRITALLLGLAAWIFVLSIALHFPVNRPLWYALALALPYGFLRWPRRIGSWPRPTWGAALLVYVLLLHWLVALKPEVSADGLSMHLAIPMMVTDQHRFPFDFQHYTWALSPMGGDFVFTAAYLLGGEAAARLLNFTVLVVVAAIVYGAARRWLTPGRAALTTALFASTPLVQLVTGSLFVENLWAAFLAGAVMALSRGEFAWAGALLGTALSVKLGTAAYLVPAAVIAAMKLWRLKQRARPAAQAVALVALCAAPPYAYAWYRTGNPIFPFANATFRSPYFDKISLRDARFTERPGWNAPFDATFRSQRYIEGEGGAIGFQYLLLVPLIFAVRRRPPVAPLVLGLAGASLSFFSIPNLRYLYPALPLFSIAIAWLIAEAPPLAPVAAGLLALNLWFLPAAGWYHPDFALFTRAQFDEYLERSAPARKLIAVLNRDAPGQPVAFFGGSWLAGLRAPAYTDQWHTYRFSQRLEGSRGPGEVAALLRDFGIRRVITSVPPDNPSVAVRQFVERWTAPAGAASGHLELRAVLAVPRTESRTLTPASAGTYDDLDPRIDYSGAWHHNREFAAASGGSLTYSNHPGDTARFAFEGSAVTCVYTQAFNRGIVEVRIDAQPRGEIDLYAKDTRWRRQTTFGDLKPGPHTIELRVSGRKNPRATDLYVDLDALVVAAKTRLGPP